MMDRKNYAELCAENYARRVKEGNAFIDYEAYRAFLAGVKWSDEHQPDRLRQMDIEFIVNNYANFSQQHILDLLAETGCFLSKLKLRSIRQKFRLHRIWRKLT